MNETDDLKDALYSIDPKSLDYQRWVEVGMALKHGGYDCSLWDDWSKNDSRYTPRGCANKWRTFKGNSSVVTIKSIFKMAREAGWVPEGYKGHALDWEDEITQDEPYSPNNEVSVDKTEAKSFELPHNYDHMTGVQQLKVYLETLFKPDEYVGIVTESFQREDGKWTPANRGDYSRTAGKLIKSLEKYPNDLGATTGDWNQEAGAWIRFNPCDGQGVRDVNATDRKSVV